MTVVLVTCEVLTFRLPGPESWPLIFSALGVVGVWKRRS